MSVPEYVRRKYSTMFVTHPPFAYEHTEDSILARLRCDIPTTMPYKEQPIHSCAAERTRRLSLPPPDRVALEQTPGRSGQPFSPPKRSLTAPNETINSNGKASVHPPRKFVTKKSPERIASDWPDSFDLVSDHDDWTIVEPVEALTPTETSVNKSTGVNRCPRCKTNIPRYFPNEASHGTYQNEPLCACSDIKKYKHQQRRQVDCSEPVQVLRGAWWM